MKKTDKTALTAALFAAAMGAAAAGGGSADASGMSEAELSLAKFSAVYGPPPDYYYTDLPVTTEYDPFEIVPQPDYGPIYIYTTATAPEETTPVTELIPQPAYGPMWTVPVTEEVQTTTIAYVTETAEPAPTTSATDLIPQPAYGPMWTVPVTETTEPITTEVDPQPTYGPPLIVGDLNGDGEVDTFDFVKMRKIVSDETAVSERMTSLRADMNGDDEVNVADLVTLGRYVIGRPVSIVMHGKSQRFNEGSEYNSIPVLDEDGNYVYDPLDPIPQPAYGPPIDYEPETEEPTQDIEVPNYQTAYGPPSFFGLEDK